MKTLKNLSNRGVDLITIKDQIAVRRIGTSEQISSILSFYQQTEYPYRPKIIQHGEYTDHSYIIEEFITGEHHNFIASQDKKKLIQSLLSLYQNLKNTKNLQTFLHQEYLKKLKSLPPFDEKTLEILNAYFSFFLQKRAESEEINIHQIHGDLKPDNIIFNKDQAILIDWERNKIGHFLEDIQKFIEKTYQYEPQKVDSFLNLFFEEQSISRKDFLYLESFFFFLNKILDLSKNRITLEQFIQKIEAKLNLQEKAKIYNLRLHKKEIKIGLQSPLSEIFKDQEPIPDTHKADLISTFKETNNQQQRLLINSDLMLKQKDFIILHGAALLLKNGKKIVISGPSGSGKSHTITLLKKNKLLQEVYDEDLINLTNTGEMFALANKTFQGYHYGTYVYKEQADLSFGKIDSIVQILSGGENAISKGKLVVKNLIHESLQNNDEINDHYQKFIFPPDIDILTLPQYYNQDHFISLLEKLGIETLS